MIKDTIYQMMVTSTGKALCDSGFGERGRHWQRNQMDYPTIESIEKTASVVFEQPEQFYTLTKNGEFVRRFRSEKNALEYINNCDVEKNSFHIEKEKLDSHCLEATVNIFHYLTEVLDIDNLCEQFNALECKDWDGDGAYGISKEQQEWLENNGLSLGETWNSYNGESNLSQALQGCNVNIEGNESNFEFPEYILLQIHQGADVRGGYTDAKLFRVAVEYFNTNPTVFGDIDGVPIDNSYDGYNFGDDDGNAVPMHMDSKINLFTITD